MKLHLGCGSKKLSGYLNIDIRKTPAIDLICDCQNLSVSDNSVDEILSFHLFEHLENPLKALTNWRQKLKVGGKLIIECPDIEAVIHRIYLKTGNLEDILNFIYGKNFHIQKQDPLYYSYGQLHKFGYSKKTIKKLLSKKGFEVSFLGMGTAEGRVSEYALRVEAIKK